MYNASNKITIVFLIFLVIFSIARCKTNTKKKAIESSENAITVTENVEGFKDYYPSGNLKSEGQFIDGKKTGKWISYYENGKQQSIQNYKKGVLHGYQKMDYSQVLCMEGFFKDGIKIGTWKSYFKENKVLKYLKHFNENGEATGEWRSYYDSSELASIENYLNNKANGKQVEYFKNGTISSIGKKKDGRENGEWKYYFDDGTLRLERGFKNGADDGKYIEYFKNGRVYKIGTTQNFKKTGTWKIYNKQGDLVETVSYDK